ncbi:MAG: hypothetical protein ACTSO9_05700 [Candidatus Helarchaeota archaeon]
MEQSLKLKFLGIGSNAIRARNTTDEGVIHGILLQNKDRELAIFISTIGFKMDERENNEIAGVVGGFTLEDLREHLDRLREEGSWVPLGLVQIDLGEKAVANFLNEGNAPFTLINLIKGVDGEKFNHKSKKIEESYFSYIL